MDALADAGIVADPELIRHQTQSATYGYAQTLAMLRLANPPTAVIAAGNDIMQGALRAIRALRLRVPQDLSLIGADDPDLSDIVSPPLTIVHRDMSLVGQSAARMLLTRLLRPSEPVPAQRLFLPSEILLRESTAPPGRAPRGLSRSAVPTPPQLAT